MPHDPELVAETSGWMIRASRDIAGARVDLAAEPPLTGDAVFHAQQTAEKTLKAFLTWHSEPFRKTHNLTELGELCTKLDPSLDALLRRASILTEYAWRYRYPGESEDPSRREAEEAIALGCEVYEAILARLPQDVHPSGQE